MEAPGVASIKARADPAQQFGDYSKEALALICSLRDVDAPGLRAELRSGGRVALKPLAAKALTMGDELHTRANAVSSLLANALAPELISVKTASLIETLCWLRDDEFLGLAVAMAAAKASSEQAEGVEYSTLVTAMARTWVEFGIQVSALSGQLFRAPAPVVESLLVPGYSADDAGLTWASWRSRRRSAGAISSLAARRAFSLSLPRRPRRRSRSGATCPLSRTVRVCTTACRSSALLSLGSASISERPFVAAS